MLPSLEFRDAVHLLAEGCPGSGRHRVPKDADERRARQHHICVPLNRARTVVPKNANYVKYKFSPPFFFFFLIGKEAKIPYSIKDIS